MTGPTFRTARARPRAGARCRDGLRLAAALALGLGVADAADSVVPWQDRPWRFTWDERLAAGGQLDAFPGFSRQPRTVRAGLWGGGELAGGWSDDGQAARLPGLAPLADGWQARLDVGQWLAHGRFFAQAQAEVLASADEPRIPAALASGLWNDPDATLDAERLEAVPRFTVGTRLLGHLALLSNQPFRWGEGIFGGIVAGQAWRGFPHVALLPQQAWNPGGDWFVTYELVAGQPEDDGGERGFAGYRLAVRQRWITVSLSAAARWDADGGVGAGDVGEALVPGRDPDRDAAAAGSGADRVQSVGLRLDPWHGFALSCEFGVDDVDDGAGGDRLGIFPLSDDDGNGALTATLDWLDVTGDADWRTAVEWFQAGAAFAGGPAGGWTSDQAPIGHADGGNSTSLRWLVQYAPGDDLAWTLVAGWRRLGRRNAEDGDADAGAAPRSWDRFSADLRVEVPWDALVVLVESGLGYVDDRRFVAGDDGLDGWFGVGLRAVW